ncbi:MAG: DNA methyltransferase [Acidimicrobiales bacterium]
MDHKPGIRKTAVTELKPHPSNPRQGDVGAIIQSIEANGWYGTLVAQISTGHVLAGNHRLQAAIHCGLDRVPVHWVDVDDDTAHRILLADNRTTDLATYDEHALADLLVEMGKTGNLEGSGYDGDDLDDLLAELERHGPDSEDPAVPDAPEKAVTKPGDLILLGDHRLMCGDATDPDTYITLLENPVDCVWTDPPYGVSYVGGTKDALTIENDDLDEAQLTQLIEAAFNNVIVNTRKGAAWFVAHPGGPLHLIFGKTLHDLGVLRQQLIWVKNSLVLGRSDYHYRHEPIYYGWTPGAAHHEPRDRKQDTIFEIDKPSANRNHPTMKPTALIEQMLRHSTDVGDTILDPFAGSGSTLIAAHNLDRRAAVIELDPGYCDVIVQRWEDHTGQSAIRP